jgi:phospho-N-acetylmuramoyl-pentapeptide-transferase
MLVVTSLSDILQLLWLRFKRRRLIRMAPLHHHLELCGMSETSIVAVYGIVTAILCMISLLLLK